MKKKKKKKKTLKDRRKVLGHDAQTLSLSLSGYIRKEKRNSIVPHIHTPPAASIRGFDLSCVTCAFKHVGPRIFAMTDRAKVVTKPEVRYTKVRKLGCRL